jgi:metallophosphoesterase superfamily enzyme
MSRSRAELSSQLLHVEIEPGWFLSSGRALFLESESTLVVADIHWGYAESHRRAGNLLPSWGDAETARRLRALLDFYAPRRMIWLGDSLHTSAAAGAAEEFLAQHAPAETIVLRGNHDRAWPRINADDYRLGRCFFHHGDRDRTADAGPDDIEITGHVHPVISLGDGAGLRLKIPALVHGPRRLILPSFSDWSAGAPWNGEVAADEKLWVVSSRRIWAVSSAQL